MFRMDSSTESLATASVAAAAPAAAADLDKPLPLDLSHLYSEVSKRRIPSKMKEFYRFFQIPGVGNLAGGTYSEISDVWVSP